MTITLNDRWSITGKRVLDYSDYRSDLLRQFVDSMNLNCHELGFTGRLWNGTSSFIKLNDLSAYFSCNNKKKTWNSLMSWIS